MTDETGRLESPFLDEELFVGDSEEEWEPRVAALVAESPFQSAFEQGREPFESPEMEEPRSFDEEPDEEWSDVEYDSPKASSSCQIDSLLAVQAFANAKLAFIGKPLTPARSKAAIRWNEENHPKKSGVDPTCIRTALQSYVDLSAVSTAIKGHNSQNPDDPISLGTKPVDAEFVEAIHQFQMKCYKDSKQHDGSAGPSVLDSLGFWPRKGLLSKAQTNKWAERLVHRRTKGIEEALSTSTDLTRDLTQSNWWSSFVNPCFLGWEFARPIHIYFARKLRKAELWLLSQSRFAGKTPVELAALLD
ncbi:MAG: hypothetical protein L0Y60_17955, partial [Beijerinckiaceae bacterium]|nr:hypothetical protein [Beijerinckiaceae bacterium]